MRLRAARIERDELRHRPHRPRVRRPAVLALVLFDQLPDPRADSAPPRGELVPHRLRDAGDLPPVPVRPRDRLHAEPGRQVLGQGPLRDRARGRFRRVQRRPVQSAPGPPVPRPGRQRVLPQDPVEDRVVHVQLRVMVPAGVLRERRDHPLMRVHEPARALAVVTRPAVTRLALQVLQHRLVPGHDRVPHHLRPPSPLPRFVRPASFPGLLGPDLQRRVQQADRLGHRERRVEEIHRGALVLQRLHDDLVPALLRGLRLGREQPGDPPGDLLVVAGEPARRPPERRLARRIPRISERAVEPLHHLVVHLRAGRQAQLAGIPGRSRSPAARHAPRPRTGSSSPARSPPRA